MESQVQSFHSHIAMIQELDMIEEEEVLDIAMVLGLIGILIYHDKYYNKRPMRTSVLRGHDFVLELMNGHEGRCFDLLRMDPFVLEAFCNELKEKTGLKDSKHISALEQVAIFLYIIGHNERNRIAADRFQHSGETISRIFNKLLRKVCKLGVLIIQPPSQNYLPPEIAHNPNYYPFFKNCIGAIDGTHIDACIPSEDQIPYRGKKIETTQNIMCVCSFDMCFTYVMSGWEGTANDSRVIFETIHNPENKFPMPQGDKYYVVDSGYGNMPGFLSPYRGERYHLLEYQRQGPAEGIDELFNYRHSSLRNVIERCFGVLKARFPILSKMPPYPVKTQKYIPIACCTIHNFIRRFNSEDELFRHFENEELVVEGSQGGANTRNSIELDISRASQRRMRELRDKIARQIWDHVNG